MKYLKTFETFDDAFYDILSTDDDRKKELNHLINQAEDENSEGGKDWSDSEREKITKKVKQLAPDLVSAPERVSQSTKMKNSLKIAINNAKTLISKVEETMDDERYSPENPLVASKLKSQIQNLKSAIKMEDVSKIESFSKLLIKSLEDSNYTYSM